MLRVFVLIRLGFVTCIDYRVERIAIDEVVRRRRSFVVCTKIEAMCVTALTWFDPCSYMEKLHPLFTEICFLIAVVL